MFCSDDTVSNPDIHPGDPNQFFSVLNFEILQAIFIVVGVWGNMASILNVPISHPLFRMPLRVWRARGYEWLLACYT